MRTHNTNPHKYTFFAISCCSEFAEAFSEELMRPETNHCALSRSCGSASKSLQ